MSDTLHRLDSVSSPDADVELISIDIGCGGNKVRGVRYGVDKFFVPGVDIVCDFECGLPFATNSIDVIVTRHVLEHIQNLELVLREFVRVVKPGGKVDITVPHFSNTLGYSDYTHKRFFGYYSFNYFSRDRDRYWNVPHYTHDIWFKIVSRRFCFRNFSFFGKALEFIFNGNSFLAYIYESKLSWWIPCFELRFELLVDKS